MPYTTKNIFCLICSGSQGLRTDSQSDLLGCCGTSGIVCGVLTLAMSVCACVCTLLYGSLLIIKLAYLTLVIICLHFAVFALDVCILWPWLYGPLILGLRSLHVQSEIFVCIFLYLALICTVSLNCQNASQNACYGCEKCQKSNPFRICNDG